MIVQSGLQAHANSLAVVAERAKGAEATLNNAPPVRRWYNG